MGKVFKMNDFDWVYADNQEQAKEYYVNETGCYLEDIEMKEVSFKDTMLYEVSKLPIEEQKQTQEMAYFAGELCAYKTFEWVINQDKIETPCVIASTEY